MSGRLDLLDWRRRTAELYADARRLWPNEAAAAHARWRATRDELFATHPQSPIPAAERAAFPGLAYYAYNPSLAFVASVEPLSLERTEVPTSTGTPMTFERIGVVRLPIGSLEVFWLDTYGGGLFVPLRDATAGVTTYGAGRYVLDTVKGADLGSTPAGELVVDLNFAYQPSCSYDPSWACPLAPPGNRLDVPVEAGERLRTA